MNDSGLGTLLGAGLAILVIWFALSGLVTGALARFLLPGPDPMGWLATIGYGIGGGIVGGLVSRLLGVPQSFSFVMSVAGAAALIWFFRRRKTSS
jgi:uncharacterized membrane protein YeaQ/YmgE (transglycosylase-associated protein family)